MKRDNRTAYEYNGLHSDYKGLLMVRWQPERLRSLPSNSLYLIYGLYLWSASASSLCGQGADATPTSFRQAVETIVIHNASSCVECHSVPSDGGSSRVTVQRAIGPVRENRQDNKGAGGVPFRTEEGFKSSSHVRGLRVALNLLGDGYVEAIPDDELLKIAVNQRKQTHGIIHGQDARATLPESTDGRKAIGRLGWKSQHASVLSASAEALYSELGIPNQFFPGAASAPVGDLESIVRFLRSSEPIAPDPELSVTDSAKSGAGIFGRIGCSICHVSTLRTAAKGAKMLGGLAKVPDGVADKEIHPYSDFLLHDVGTGDGVLENIRPQDYDITTANKFRTAPLWGVRFRSWLMHDGKSITYHQAIVRHGVEASGVVQKYQNLTPAEKEQLRRFLDSL